jgi:hypothetical protein
METPMEVPKETLKFGDKSKKGGKWSRREGPVNEES